MEVRTCHLKNSFQNHARIGMILRKQRTLLGFTLTSFIKSTWIREIHFQHPEFQHGCQLFNMNLFNHGEEIRKSSMAQQQTYQDTPRSWIHICIRTVEAIVRPTISCPMVWVWFDNSLSLIWVGLSRLEDNISKRSYYLVSTLTQIDIPYNLSNSSERKVCNAPDFSRIVDGIKFTRTIPGMTLGSPWAAPTAKWFRRPRPATEDLPPLAGGGDPQPATFWVHSDI